MAMASLQTSPVIDELSIPKLSWSAPMSAKRWIDLGHLVGIADGDVSVLDLLLDLLGRLIRDRLGPNRDARRPREGVEVPEHEAQVVADVEVVEDLARPLPVFEAEHLGRDHDVVVHVAADGIGVLDVLLVLLDERSELLGLSEREAEHSESLAGWRARRWKGFPPRPTSGGCGFV